MIQALSQLNGVLSDAGHVIVNCIMVSATVWYNTMMVRCRRTNVEDDLSWGFDHFVNNELGVVDVSPRASSAVLDTYLDFGDKEMLSEPLEVVLLCFIGVDGLGERLMFIMFRKEWIQFAGIEGAIGVKPLLDGLQLWSASIEVGHSERAGFILVDGSECGRERAGFLGGSSLCSHSNHVQG